MLDPIVEPGSLKVVANENGVALVVFDNENHGTVLHAEGAAGFGEAGRETMKVDPTPAAL